MKQHAQAATDRLLVRTHFWLAALETEPAKSSWPDGLSQRCLPQRSWVGCRFAATSPANCSCGRRLATHTWQPATSTGTTSIQGGGKVCRSDDRLWLRIAQSECLASLSQTQPSGSAKYTTRIGQPRVAAAANAALGSAKLQSGAFQQERGVRQGIVGSCRGMAQANSGGSRSSFGQLIMGDVEAGFRALHAAHASSSSRVTSGRCCCHSKTKLGCWSMIRTNSG